MTLSPGEGELPPSSRLHPLTFRHLLSGYLSQVIFPLSQPARSLRNSRGESHTSVHLRPHEQTALRLSAPPGSSTWPEGSGYHLNPPLAESQLSALGAWAMKQLKTKQNAKTKSKPLGLRKITGCYYSFASVVSDSLRPHRWQPTRLHHPWDSSGKNTGVGCHSLVQTLKLH